MKALRLLIILILLAVSVARAADPGPRVAMNFKDTEIEGVVKFISELTGKNFILDDKVKGKITVISPTELTLDEAYQVFQAILGVKGFTIVPAGKVLKIMPQGDAKQTNIETAQGLLEPGDRIVTRLVPLKNVGAATLTQILDPLRSKFSSIQAYEPTNLLIITDANSNIDRLMSIVDAIDVPTPGMEMEIFRIHFADATNVANTLNQALAQSGSKRRAATRTSAAPGQPAGAAPVQGDTQGIKVIPDSRTNSIIVIAEASAFADVRSLLASLDVELPTGKGKINVVQLKYASAETMATVLNSISQSGSKAKSAPAAPQVRATVAGQPAQVQAAQAQAQKGDDMTVHFDEPVTITADKATNSLIIVALPQDFATLKSVIDKLDVLRPQVLVEALIIQMDFKKVLELGVEWRTTDSQSANVVGATNFGNINSLRDLATNPLAGPNGMYLAAIDGTIKVGDKVFPNIGALVKALQTNTDGEVLSTPNLLTTDNEEAEIVVSDNIPFQTSTVYDSTGNPRYNYEYRDVGLTLRFTPQINDDNFVKLKLFQETSSVDSATNLNQLAPSSRKRTAKTTIVVKDGATVVIGGLIQDKKNTSQSAVPCLGDIPVLGALFRSQSKTNDKTNLMIFLTPHIIRDPSDMTRVSEDKRKKHEEFTQTIKDMRTLGNGAKAVIGLDDKMISEGQPEKINPPRDSAPAPAGGQAK